MKTPEQLLRQLERHDVAELVLVAGKVPALRIGASLDSADSAAWIGDDILSLLMTVGGSRYVDTLGPVPKQWTSRLAGVGIVAVSAVVQRGGGVEARFSLAARNERTRPPTMPRRSERPPAVARKSERPQRAERPPTGARRSERPGVASRRSERPPTGARRSERPQARAPESEPPPPSRPKNDWMHRETVEAKRPARPPNPFVAPMNAAHPAREESSFVSSSLPHDALPPPSPASALVKPKRKPDSDAPPERPPPEPPSRVRTMTPPAMGEVQPASPSIWGLDRANGAPARPVVDGRVGRPATKPMGDIAPVTPMPPPPVARKAHDGARDAIRALEAHLRAARAAKATDLHVVAGRPLLLRVAGDIRPSGDPLSANDVERILMSSVPDRLLGTLEEHGSCDFALQAGELGRFRVNIGRQQTGLKASIRILPLEVPTFESLGLPATIGPAMRHHQGLIVVTGPTGHGKTSTLAAIVDVLNQTTTGHIITVEDPIEYLHPKKTALVSQREVGTHTRSFASALKGALREDPDVIVVGELRDTETVRMAVSASETGHLVVGTMNTPSAAKTIDRLIDLFPPADQPQVRTALASGLRLIVGQRLLPSADRARMHAAFELLPGSVPLSALIREAKTFQIPSLQQRSKGLGITRMDDSLAALVQSHAVSLEVARAYAEAPFELDALVGMRGGR